MKKLTTSITKILDLALSEIGEDFLNEISGHESYNDSDNFPCENLYSPYQIAEKLDDSEIQISDQNLFAQIFKICEKKDCAYFRIIS